MSLVLVAVELVRSRIWLDFGHHKISGDFQHLRTCGVTRMCYVGLKVMDCSLGSCWSCVLVCVCVRFIVVVLLFILLICFFMFKVMICLCLDLVCVCKTYGYVAVLVCREGDFFIISLN